MRLPTPVKATIFALLVMGSYAMFANSIPQIESKPPQELSLEGGNVTQAQLVKAGEEIFHTKGTCEICHRIGQKGTRAPDLGGVGARAGKTKPGMSAKAYILESLLQPDRKSTRLNSSHITISYAVFCLKKKNKKKKNKYLQKKKKKKKHKKHI